ncbi:hypothetical protein PTKIN_Ptkin06aG0147600 [Pterospermum kingtungense]
MFVANLLGKWTRKSGTILLDGITFLVFLFLGFLDAVLCVIYKLLDEFFEGKPSNTPCHCRRKRGGNDDGEEKELSETVNRWSDCGCESCVSWMKKGNDQKLHFVVRELPQASGEDSRGKPAEIVIFLHGFLSSSSFCTEKVFKNLSGPVKDEYYRLFAVDLLGFGRSPNPSDSLYTLSDHVEMIEKFIIFPCQLESFHLVAHSMGCIVAVALAAKHSKFVKSVTLAAPPYFPSGKDGISTSIALNALAGKTVATISIWELGFMVVDLTRHTHHSGWHTMHNVICGEAKFMDEYLEIVNRSKSKRLYHPW